MPKSDRKLKHCLKRLVALGKRNQGYITFKSISNLTAEYLDRITMDAIDWIYKNLSTAQIEVVDQLPDGIIAFAEPQTSTQKFRQSRNRYAKKYQLNTHFKSDRRRLIIIDDNYLCSENGIDQLLCQWEEAKEITEDHFFSIIEKCGLSHKEVEELIEYLGSIGIDYPEKYEQYFGVNELLEGIEAYLL